MNYGALFVVSTLLAIVFGGHAAGQQSKSKKRPPNIVFFLVDDLGWTDLGCYGSPFYETPNIDRLATEGVRFTDAYAACHVCSPTRASIMTGKYPARLHLTDWLTGRKDFPFQKLKNAEIHQQLPLEETTLAEGGIPRSFQIGWARGQGGRLPDGSTDERGAWFHRSKQGTTILSLPIPLC